MDLDLRRFIRLPSWKGRAPEPFNFVELSETIAGLSVKMR